MCQTAVAASKSLDGFYELSNIIIALSVDGAKGTRRGGATAPVTDGYSAGMVAIKTDFHPP
jgi:hypothetical protein